MRTTPEKDMERSATTSRKHLSAIRLSLGSDAPNNGAYHQRTAHLREAITGSHRRRRKYLLDAARSLHLAPPPAVRLGFKSALRLPSTGNALGCSTARLKPSLAHIDGARFMTWPRLPRRPR